MAELESMKDIQEERKATWGGARKGAGRAKHSKNKKTIEREEAVRQFKDRVANNIDRLFNAQLDLAIGEKYLMVKITEKDSKGKVKREYHEIITDPEIIKQYLDGELDDTDEEYYYMSTKGANNQALEGLLNRAFGRATEHVDHTSDGDKIEPVVIYRPEKLDKYD